MPIPDDRLTRYVQELVERWLTEHDAGARDLARLAGVTDTAISDIRKGRSKRGVGRDLLIGLSRAMAVSLDEIVAAAERWDGAGPIEVPASERVERPERYSNFVLAAEVERRAGVSEDAIRAARAELKSAEDLSVDEWRSEIRASVNRLRRAATAIPTGRSIDERNAARDAERTRSEIEDLEAEAAAIKASVPKPPPPAVRTTRTVAPPPPLKPPEPKKGKKP
jgi:transcriptional regulator with XRE-family HTH domain